MQIPIAKTLSVVAILSIFGVIAGITAVTAQDDSDAHIAQSSKDYVPPTPTMQFTRNELLSRAMDERAARKSQVPVVQGTPIDLPSGAWNDGLQVTGDPQPIEKDDGEIIRPLEMPFYHIIYKGEIALVSKSTGHFEIGENQQDTFQFLIDELGRDKMVLLPDAYYEDMWGLHWQDALDEAPDDEEDDEEDENSTGEGGGQS